jgi:hypothetical protein
VVQSVFLVKRETNLVGEKGLMFEKCQIDVSVKFFHVFWCFVFSLLYVFYRLEVGSRRASPTCVQMLRMVVGGEDDCDCDSVCGVGESVVVFV